MNTSVTTYHKHCKNTHPVKTSATVASRSGIEVFVVDDAHILLLGEPHGVDNHLDVLVSVT